MVFWASGRSFVWNTPEERGKNNFFITLLITAIHKVRFEVSNERMKVFPFYKKKKNKQ